jgi:hypothetical protein
LRVSHICFLWIANVVLGASAVLAFGTARRLPEPDAAAQATAQKTVGEIFHTELADHTAAGQASAAAKLLDAAEQTHDDPVGKYVLLKSARELACVSGALDVAITASGRTASLYAVDGPKLQLSTLSRLAAKVSKPADLEALAAAAAAVAEELGTSGEWDASAQAGKVAETAAANSRDPDTIARTKSRLDTLRKGQADFDRIRAAQAVLAKNPGDAEACRTVATYLCLTKGDWKSGLATLGNTSDAPLKSLVAQDAASPTAADTRAALADAWWDYSASQPDQLKIVGEARAANWYGRIVDTLPVLRKLQVQKRLKTAEADLASVAPVMPASPERTLVRAKDTREMIESAETEPYPAEEVTEDTVLAPSSKPYRIEKTLKVKGVLTIDAGVELRGGSIDLGGKGHLKINGTPDKPVIFRNVVIVQDLGASVYAQFSDFDQCVFRKGGAWFSHFSSKWQFSHCVLYKCKFPRLTGVDYGFEIVNCALVSMNFPDIDQGANTVSLLRANWNKLISCDFVDCSLPPTVFWCSERSNFRGCKFASGKSFTIDNPLTVDAFVVDGVGAPPQDAWDTAARDKIQFQNAATPFPTLHLPRNTEIPEVVGGNLIGVSLSQFH